MDFLLLRSRWFLSLCLLGWTRLYAWAEAPTAFSFQGRISVEGVPFSGTGLFRFALVQGTGAEVLMNLDPLAGSPGASVSIPVSKGLYSVRFGIDTIPVPESLLIQNSDLRLRVWFDDGAHGLQLLSPDQPILAVPYARRSLSAATADSATSMSGTISASQVSGSLSYAQLPNTVARLDSDTLFTGTVTAQSFRGAGTLPWTRISSPSFVPTPNGGYLASRPYEIVDFTLPQTAQIGDVIRLGSDGSGIWQVRNPSGQRFALGRGGNRWAANNQFTVWSSMASSQDGIRWVACTTSGQIHTSSDGGLTWTLRNSGHFIYRVASSSDGTRLVAAEADGYLYTSTDSGLTWQQRASRRLWRSVASSFSGGTLIAAAQNDQLYVSYDSGSTWTAKGPVRKWQGVDMSDNGSRMVACAYGDKIYTSANAGQTWTPGNLTYSWNGVTSSSDGLKLAACSYAGPVVTSTDGGVTWTSGRLESWGGIDSTADGQKLVAYLYSGGMLMVSEDAGITWETPKQGSLFMGVAVSGNGSTFLAGSTSGLWISNPYLNGSEDTAEFQYTSGGQWISRTPAQLDSNGLLPLSRLPGIPAGRITSGTLNPTLIPASLPGTRHFDGPVGIGVPTPDTPLSIRPDTANGTFGYCIALTDRNLAPVWKLGVSVSDHFSIGAAGLRDNDIAINRTTGNVGLGATPYSNMKLRVAGDLYVDGTGNAVGGFRSTSDARLKTAVAPLDHALDSVLRLQGVSFEWAKQALPGMPQGRQIGLIAQEVAKIAPELVDTNSLGYLNLQYDGFAPLLIEAAKELHQIVDRDRGAMQAELQSLRTQCATQHEQIQALQIRLGKLEQQTPTPSP